MVTEKRRWEFSLQAEDRESPVTYLSIGYHNLLLYPDIFIAGITCHILYHILDVRDCGEMCPKIHQMVTPAVSGSMAAKSVTGGVLASVLTHLALVVGL